jgi:hypothetical protein
MSKSCATSFRPRAIWETSLVRLWPCRFELDELEVVDDQQPEAAAPGQSRSALARMPGMVLADWST